MMLLRMCPNGVLCGDGTVGSLLARCVPTGCLLPERFPGGSGRPRVLHAVLLFRLRAPHRPRPADAVVRPVEQHRMGVRVRELLKCAGRGPAQRDRHAEHVSRFVAGLADRVTPDPAGGLAARSARRCGVSRLESVRPSGGAGNPAFATTAQTTTGPAQAPRPTSPTPAARVLPTAASSRSIS